MDTYKDHGNQSRRREVDAALADRFNRDVSYYLMWSVKFLIADSLRLVEVVRSAQSEFSDYSFVIAPAYKAFEGFLYQLGLDLGIYTAQDLDSIHNVAARYDEEQVRARLEQILDGVLDLSQPAAQDKLREISSGISELRNHLRRFRHSPAHFQGMRVVPNLTRASQHIESLIFYINDLVMLLKECKILSVYRGDINYRDWP
jgi:hypothetical protein